MYAMVEISGRQYKAEEGTVLTVDRLPHDAGAEITLDKVVLFRTDKEVKVGSPYVKGASVTATVEGHGLGAKLKVRKFKRRKNYHRTIGHRSKVSTVRIKGLAGA